jgi:hypothetical protein
MYIYNLPHTTTHFPYHPNRMLVSAVPSSSMHPPTLDIHTSYSFAFSLTVPIFNFGEYFFNTLSL